MLPIHDQHRALLELVKQLEGQIDVDEGERRSAEVAAADATSKLQQYQEQINRVTTQREYGALLKEIDTAKAKVSTHEDAALALLERVESARRELEQARAEFAELDRRYRELLEQWERGRPEVVARLADVERDIDRLRRLIPGQMLRQFELLYRRLDGETLSTVTKMPAFGRSQAAWHCSVCNYRVRPQIIVEIKNTGALVQCERCQRFLRVEDHV
ncbi:MAG TPA: C4-type zinc ribbon domain-containing protein [Thermoanaerobaculia bacterium]|nr:C4-type zinc ribbon domain-containing protein [Thermoanaerobaculia bacterium]